MTKGRITALFWVLSVGVFFVPILFYFFTASPRLQVLEPANPQPQPPGIQIHVSGALESPGVYTVKPGTKLIDLLPQLDLLDSATTHHLNLAKTLRDGQKISIKESPQAPVININLATKRQLMTLPGIGPSLANTIIRHRNAHGAIQHAQALAIVIGQKKTSAIQHRLVF